MKNYLPHVLVIAAGMMGVMGVALAVNAEENPNKIPTEDLWIREDLVDRVTVCSGDGTLCWTYPVYSQEYLNCLGASKSRLPFGYYVRDGRRTICRGDNCPPDTVYLCPPEQ